MQSEAPAGRRGWATHGAVAASWVAYMATLAFYQGPSVFVAPLGVIPIILTGLFYGPLVGTLGAIALVGLAFAITQVLQGGDPTEAVRLNAFRWGVGVALGYTSGALAQLLRRERELARRLDAQSQALRHSEARLKGVLDSQQALIVRVGPDNRITYMNDAYQKAFGLRVGETFWTKVHPDDEAKTQQALDRLRAPPYTSVIEQRCEIAGQWRTILWQDSVIHDEAGNVVEIQGVGFDVTERQAAEEGRQRALQQLKEAQASAHLGSWEADLTSGVTVWSDETWRQLGLARDQAKASLPVLLDCVHPDDREAVQAQVVRSVRDGTPADFELRIVRPGGEVRRLAARIFPTTVNGLTVRLSGTNQDVTEHRAAEEDLRQSEERFRLASLATRDVIWDLDVPSGRLLWGGAMQEAFGYPIGDLAPDLSSWTQRIHPEDLPAVTASFDEALHGARSQWQHEYRFQRADGTYAHVLDRGFMVRDATGTVVRAVGAMADLSHQRAAEEKAREADTLRELAEMKTQFLSIAAHELSTPLTPLKLQLASMRPGIGEHQKAGFALLERNVNRMALLISDLLDAARLQSGRLRLEPHPIDLSALAQRVAQSFQAQADQTGVDVDVDAPEPIVAECDEARLEQVLFNLVHNGLKFTPRGGHIHLHVERAGRMARIDVQDTGLGLSGDQIRRLAQPFIQVHDASKVKAGGTGLGLYIVRGIAEQHGGKLVIRSAGPNQGSTFTVQIPVAGPPMAKADGQDGPRRLPAAS